MLYIKIRPLTISMSRERSHDLQLQSAYQMGKNTLSTGSANVLIVVCKEIFLTW